MEALFRLIWIKVPLFAIVNPRIMHDYRVSLAFSGRIVGVKILYVIALAAV